MLVLSMILRKPQTTKIQTTNIYVFPQMKFVQILKIPKLWNKCVESNS